MKWHPTSLGLRDWLNAVAYGELTAEGLFYPLDLLSSLNRRLGIPSMTEPGLPNIKIGPQFQGLAVGVA